MTIPRRRQIRLSETPYYHCIGRCARRAFLCGEDRYSGKFFDHRKQWLVGPEGQILISQQRGGYQQIPSFDLWRIGQETDYQTKTGPEGPT